MASPASAVADIPYAELGHLGRYLRSCRGSEQPSTVIKKWRTLRGIEAYIGRTIAEASPEDIDRWWDALIDGGRAASTRACYLSILRDHVGWLVSRDIRADDPSRHCERPPTGRGVPRDLDPTRVKRIIRRLTGRDQDAVEIAFWTATRRAEISAIHVQDDVLTRPDGTWLRVRGKGAKEREVPLPAELAARLATRPGPWLFPSSRRAGEHLTPDRVGELITGALREGGLDGATTHQLRHTAATAMLRRTDGNLRLVQVWLGHSSPATTAIYTRTTGPRHTDIEHLYDAPRRR